MAQASRIAAAASLTFMCTGVAWAVPGVVPLRLLHGSAERIERCDAGPCDNPSVVSSLAIGGRIVAVPLRLGAQGTWHRLQNVHLVHEAISPNLFDIRGDGYHREIGIGLDGPHNLSLAVAIGPNLVELTSGDIPNGSNAFPNLDIVARADFEGDSRRAIRIVAVPACIADFDDGSGRGFPDGAVTIDDLVYYLGAFEAASIEADIGGAIDGGLDEAVTIDDLLAFLEAFEGGC